MPESYLKETVIFFILVILGLILTSILYFNFIIKNEDQYRINEDLKDYLHEHGKIDYLFLGNSHLQRSINPKFIPNSFNLAFNSNTYIENYYKLKDLIDNGVSIKYIFLQVDPHSFSSYSLKANQMKWDTWYYSQIMSLKEIANVTGRSRISIILLTIMPFLGREKELLVKNKPSELYYGHLKSIGNLTEDKLRIQSLKRIEVQFLNETLLDPTLQFYFHQILYLAKDKNISVILVANPESEAYIEALQSKNFNFNKFYGVVFFNIKVNVGNLNIKFLDSLRLFLDKPYYFSDPDHVNEEGSEIFSKYIYNISIYKSTKD